MGYRAYIGKITKSQHKILTSMGVDEIYKYYGQDRKNDDYVGPSDICKDLFEFGKYWDFEVPNEYLSPFFINEKSHKHWNSEQKLYLATKEVIEFVIDFYKKEIQKQYREIIIPFYDLDRSPCASDFLNSVKHSYTEKGENYNFDFSKITQDEQNALFKMIENARAISKEWIFTIGDYEIIPYTLKQGKNVTTSCRYEYCIFDLVSIYKTFNWKKDLLCYYEH